MANGECRRFDLAVAACVVALTLSPGVAAAQESSAAPSAEPSGAAITGSIVSLRLGAFDMVNSSESYDAVYDEPMPQLGAGFEFRFGERWFGAASIDYGEVDGERVLLADPPVATGIEQTLTLVPVHVTVGWAALPRSPWRLSLGLGPTLERYDVDGVDSESGTEVGAHAVLALQREGERWSVGGEVRYSTVPNVDLGEESILEFFGEDDLGGVSAHLVVGWRLGD